MFSILLAGLLALPGDVVEAARVDGAGNWRILTSIELPMLRPVLLVTILIRTIDSLRYLDLVLVITQGGPGRSTEILNFLAYRTAFQEFQFGHGAALAFIVFALVMVAASALLRVLWKTADADRACPTRCSMSSASSPRWSPFPACLGRDLVLHADRPGRRRARSSTIGRWRITRDLCRSTISGRASCIRPWCRSVRRRSRSS